MLKDALIYPLRSFYSDDIGRLGMCPASEQFNQKVGKVHRSEMTACAIWFKNAGALNEDDLIVLRELADHRNIVAHKLPSIIGSSKEVSILHLNWILEITSKVDQWWIREVEIPVNPDFDENPPTKEQLENCMSMRMVIMSLMSSLALGDDTTLDDIYKKWCEKQKPDSQIS